MKNGRHCHGSVFWALLAVTLTPLAATADDEVSSYAFVQEDGSLKISGQVFRLYGVYIPPTGQACYEFVRPVQCSTRAALALDFTRLAPSLYTASHRDGIPNPEHWL